MPNWEILKELTQRFTGKENPLNLEQTLDYMLQFSAYKNPKLSVSELKNHPHGLDYGALQPQLPQRLFTSDKKIDLAHPLFIKDLERLHTKLLQWKDETVSKFPFSLIGRRHLRSNNSWMHNSKRLTKGKERCTLLIHSKDAENLNLQNGQLASVTSNIGTVKLPIEITDTILQGVVSIPHGWGHHRNGTNMTIAQQHAGVSINDLTDATAIDQLTGNTDFSGTKVKIEGI